jgi:arylsulfatase A-like enzyme
MTNQPRPVIEVSQMRRTILFVFIAALGRKASPHEEILLNTTPGRDAIRVGDWKLKLQTRQNAQEVELFNLADDIAEANNVAHVHPDKAKDLRVRYDRLAAQAVPPKNKE